MPRSLFHAILAAAGFAAAFAPRATHAETIRVGVTPGPHAEIAEVAKKVLAGSGIDLKIFEFSDYARLNPALADGDLDANSFQHQPYLDQQVKDRGYKIVSIAKTMIFPMSVYSRKVKSLGDLPQGGKVAIPNDPTNGARALLLLQAQGLIKMKGSGLTVSAVDVAENPKKLKIVEVDAAQLPHVLPDVDAAVINTNFAVQAKLDPAKDAIARESKDSPYVNVIAIRAADREKPWVKKLVDAFHSPEVRKFVETKYPGVLLLGF